MFLDHIGHDFIFASRKSDHLMGILENEILSFELEL